LHHGERQIKAKAYYYVGFDYGLEEGESARPREHPSPTSKFFTTDLKCTQTPM